MKRSTVVCYLVIGILALQACSQKSLQFDEQAQRFGFSVETLNSEHFRHRVYRHNDMSKQNRLHVYLDGDGQPWINNKLVSTDPTPKKPMMLELMALDSAPSIYLGRPCYHGFSSDPLCDSALWTSHRYSAQVVDSLRQALQAYLEREGFNGVVLIGFSGGGTLAMLLAEQLSETRAVITIAGNLDVDAWTRHHRYTPLGGSLNPAKQAVLNPEISQYHLVGKKDRNIPFQFSQEVIKTQPNASLLIFDDFDHACCWASVWPAFLNCLKDEELSESADHSGCVSSRLMSSSP